jgi:hypothetical protein
MGAREDGNSEAAEGREANSEGEASRIKEPDHGTIQLEMPSL